MPISPARTAAFDILLRVERESSYGADLLHSASYAALGKKDHGLATELVMGVLRWRSRLDEEIAQASSQPLAKLDLEILIALRLAVYQLRYLTRIPQRAALNESVELVKRARKRSAAPFVNAVLRKLLKQPRSLAGAAAPFAEDSPAQALAAAWANPIWLVERWCAHYGPSAARAICEQNQTVPTTMIRLRAAGVDEAAVEAELAAEGIVLDPGSLLPTARRVASGDVTQTAAFRNGQIVIQDEASQLVAALAGRIEKKDARILDCCAAPGGKTLAMADANPAAEIVAVEVHPHRARLMQQLWGSEARKIMTVIADARDLPLMAQFDRVLVDAPCSGTGTLGRNPEIKWQLKSEDLTELHERQVAIVRSALKQLRRGGRLVCSTCSLEKEENEDVIARVLAEDKSLRTIDCRGELERMRGTGELTWPNPFSLTSGPYLRTIPGIHACDGFFAAIVERG